MKNKAAGIIGGALGLTAIGLLISRTLAKPALTVTLQSNPIRTAILVDEKEITTPATIKLKKGTHTFKAVAKTPNMFETYQFDKWVVNGVAVQYDNPALTLSITKPTSIRADFMLAQSGVYPIITLPQ